MTTTKTKLQDLIKLKEQAATETYAATVAPQTTTTQTATPAPTQTATPAAAVATQPKKTPAEMFKTAYLDNKSKEQGPGSASKTVAIGEAKTWARKVLEDVVASFKKKYTGKIKQLGDKGTEAQIKKILAAFGYSTDGGEKTLRKRMNAILAAAGYARGTLATKQDEFNWTHAGEIIRRSDGAILRQLPKGTQVIPKIESANLIKWAQIDPFKELKEGMTNMQTINNGGSSQQVNYYFDALVQINGNVDADMLDKLDGVVDGLFSNTAVGRKFKKKSVDTITKELVREARKTVLG